MTLSVEAEASPPLEPSQALAGRRFASRATLPTTRAVVGALLVSVAAVTAFATVRSTHGGPTGRVVVVTGDVPAGQRLSEADLDERPVDLPDALGARTFARVDEVAGAVTVAPLTAGDPVLRTTLLPRDEAPPGWQVFSFSVDRDRALDGALVAGERLDLIATFGSGEAAVTQVIARAVPLVRSGEAGRGALGAAGKVTVTVALATDDEVVRVAHASQVAAVTLVRASATATPSDPGPEARTPTSTRSTPSTSGTTAGSDRPSPTTRAGGG